MSKMEATIGPIVTKLDSILNKIDDAKRIKMKKKETMQRLIENIEDDDQSKLIKYFLCLNMIFIICWIAVDEAQKTSQIREIASRMEFIWMAGLGLYWRYLDIILTIFTHCIEIEIHKHKYFIGARIGVI